MIELVDQYVTMPNYGTDFDNSWEDEMLASIGRTAGVCYKSSKDRAPCIKRALSCIANSHHSVFEHWVIPAEILCDRGTSHAVVRHRHCAFTQNSTIYTKMTDGIKIVDMPDTDPYTGKQCKAITDYELATYEFMAKSYDRLIAEGCTAGRARDVLPQSLATILMLTTNVREWMFIAHRRRGPGDTERMHVFCKQVNDELQRIMPRTYKAFCDWYVSHPL